MTIWSDLLHFLQICFTISFFWALFLLLAAQESPVCSPRIISSWHCVCHLATKNRLLLYLLDVKTDTYKWSQREVWFKKEYGNTYSVMQVKDQIYLFVLPQGFKAMVFRLSNGQNGSGTHSELVSSEQRLVGTMNLSELWMYFFWLFLPLVLVCVM